MDPSLVVPGPKYLPSNPDLKFVCCLDPGNIFHDRKNQRGLHTRVAGVSGFPLCIGNLSRDLSVLYGQYYPRISNGPASMVAPCPLDSGEEVL